MDENKQARIKLITGKTLVGNIGEKSNDEHLQLLTETETVYIPMREIKSIEPAGTNVIFLNERAPE